MNNLTCTDELANLIENHMPEDFPHSDFYIGLILDLKGDSAPVNIKHKKPRDIKVIDEAIQRRLRRTSDFVPRTRYVPYSLRKRETYHTRRPDRIYRRRIHPRKSGARSHLRNFRPEIPNNTLNHQSSSLSTLELILESAEGQSKPFLSNGNLYVSIGSDQFKGTYRIGLVQDITEIDRYDSKPRKYSKSEFSDLLSQNDISARFFYDEYGLHLKLSSDGVERTFRLDIIENPAYVDSKTLLPFINSSFQLNLIYSDGWFDEQRYERKHSNEPQQTRPKIPFREIDAIRDRSPSMRRAKYMLVNAPKPYDGESYQVHDPVSKRFMQVESIGDDEGKYIKRRSTTWGYTPIVKMR